MSEAAISFPLLGDFMITAPSAISLGRFSIHWYGVIIATGFLLAMIYVTRRSKEFGIKDDYIYEIILFGVPVSLICARIYYVVFYWELFKDDFWSVFEIWNGGIAIYGVLIGALITVIVYCRKKKLSALALLDILGLGFLIGQFIGRWGNFMNREAYGYETDLPWKMGLTLNGVTKYVHPTFLYESVWNFIGFIIIHFASKKRKYDGQVTAYYVAWYGLGRAIIEGYRTDSLYLFNTGIRVSQLVAAVTCVLAVIYLLINRRREHKPEDMFVCKVAMASAAEDRESEAGCDCAECCDVTESDEVISEDAEQEKEEAEEQNRE